MAQLAEKPFPPGEYPVIVVGSGPGGLQTSYYLSRFGIPHAVLSGDEAPGGMFARFPVFQRLITWSKPYAPPDRKARAYEWFDWNSLLAEDNSLKGLVLECMDGTSYFPSRSEMEQGLVAFARGAGIPVRYGCRWEGTRRQDGGFVLSTSDGPYRCRVAVFAIGMARPWKPTIEGLDAVPHYVDLEPPQHYANQRVFLIGKRNSAFEVADGLLAWSRQIILGSPRPARISVLMRSTAAARARYLQPYEDHVLGGGNVVLDVSIQRVEKTSSGWRVHCQGTSRPGALVVDVDAVVAATGFGVPLLDLAELGVTTFAQGRLPAQTPFWESASVPGIYFAGAATQGSIGLKKYGIPSNSAAVHGFRYNARVLARRIAEEHFNVPRAGSALDARGVVPFLLEEASHAPELWNQQSYLARVVEVSTEKGIVDRGILPLAHVIDGSGPDSIAITVETDPEGDIHPAVYLRYRGHVEEHVMDSTPLHNFQTKEHHAHLSSLVKGWID